MKIVAPTAASKIVSWFIEPEREIAKGFPRG